MRNLEWEWLTTQDGRERQDGEREGLGPGSGGRENEGRRTCVSLAATHGFPWEPEGLVSRPGSATNLLCGLRRVIVLL